MSVFFFPLSHLTDVLRRHRPLLSPCRPFSCSPAPTVADPGPGQHTTARALSRWEAANHATSHRAGGRTPPRREAARAHRSTPGGRRGEPPSCFAAFAPPRRQPWIAISIGWEAANHATSHRAGGRTPPRREAAGAHRSMPGGRRGEPPSCFAAFAPPRQQPWITISIRRPPLSPSLPRFV
jgi:hypothetical protein